MTTDASLAISQIWLYVAAMHLIKGINSVIGRCHVQITAAGRTRCLEY